MTARLKNTHFPKILKEGGLPMARKPLFDAAQAVTDELVAVLEKGTLPWRRPWRVAGSNVPLRHNGDAYRGINSFLLSMRTMVQGYSSP